MKNGHASLVVKTLPISKLKPHPENPRKHPRRGTKAWNALKKSLENDYFDPVVFNKRNGMLVSGHLRVEVLKEMGVEKVDCVVADYDEATHKARMSAANQHAGEFDDAKLRAILEQCRDEKIDVALAGVVEAITSTPAVAEKPEVPFSEFIGEANNYVVLTFKTEIDWLNAVTHFGIKTVASQSRKGKQMVCGVGRVLDGAKYLAGVKK